LGDAVVGAGKPAQALYGYVVGDFEGQSPVVVVASAGTDPGRLTARGSQLRYFFDILVFVLRGTSGTDYDEEDADSQLDTVADAVEDWLADNQRGDDWESIEVGRSTIEAQTVGGAQYWMERTPLTITVA
jgi:hypothetical protein